MLKTLPFLCHVILLALATSLCVPTANADEDSSEANQQAKTLTIGSKAPSLDIEHWFSFGDHDFGKVTEFEDDKIYVVEFWATWCGPCISSMPHLVETQERHAEDGVQIVSISDEDEKTVKRFLKREVRGSQKEAGEEGETEKETYADLTSHYCLTSDPDRSAHTDYMKAAAQNGIPTSFIVGKSGHVEWIGHPMSIDKPLQAVVDDKWDRDSFAKEFKEKQAFALTLRKIRGMVRDKEFDEALELLSDAKENATGRNKMMANAYYQRYYDMKLQYMVQNGEADEALKLIEADIENASDTDQPQLKSKRVEMLIAAEKNTEAAEALTELIPELNPTSLNAVAWSIYERGAKSKDEFDPKLIDIGIEAVEKALEDNPKQSPILDTLAHLVYLKGDLEQALEIQTQAVEATKRPRREVTLFLEKLKKEIAKAASDKQTEANDV